MRKTYEATTKQRNHGNIGKRNPTKFQKEWPATNLSLIGSSPSPLTILTTWEHAELVRTHATMQE